MADPDALAALLADATPGPWDASAHSPRIVDGSDDPVARTFSDSQGHADAAAIVALRNLAPALLALWEAARDVLAVYDSGDVMQHEDVDALRAALDTLEALP